MKIPTKRTHGMTIDFLPIIALMAILVGMLLPALAKLKQKRIRRQAEQSVVQPAKAIKTTNSLTTTNVTNVIKITNSLN